MNVSGNSYYVNPNTRTLTSNINNTRVYDKSVVSAISSTLRPVDDMMGVLNTPISLAEETSVNRRNNSINLALGASVKVAGDFTLIVKPKGVEVNGVTDWRNQEESQEAHDMAGALATLLRNAAGIMNEVGFSSVDKAKWTENVSKVLGRFGIDTSKDFTVNGMKYTRDENGYFVSEAKMDAMKAYEQLKLANQTYEFADERTKKAITYMSDYYLKTAPDAVAKAWQETLEETGINPFPEGYTSVLQQLSMEQDFGTGGNDNLFGDTMESSIEAINKILERIDNSIGKNGSDNNEYLNHEKEFYETLLSKIYGAEAVDETKDISDEDYMELIRKQIEEMQEKIDNDEVNESFQIGGQIFNVEEWDEFLKKFDSIQDAMEALMKERHEKMEEQQTNTEEVVDATTTEMIVSESTSCTYPTDSSNGEDVLHITWYTEEGIFCRKAGQTEGYEWCIPFENKEQYDKVMEFIGQLPKDSDWRFASQESFWQEFLYGENSVDTTTVTSSTRRTEIKVSNFKEHETSNYKFVPEPTIGKGGMRILKNGQSVAVFSVDNLKIRVDEKTGTRVLISEIPGIGNSWYDALPVDAELENGLAEAIGVDDIPEVALEGYYIGTHAGTGIQYVMRPGDEGRGGKVLLKDAADVAKYNALAEEYFNRYPNLVTSPEYGRIYASFEICGMMERTPTGFVRIGFDNISYNDNLDYKKNWSAKITEETWDLLWEWLEDNRSHMDDVGEFSTWGDIIDELGGSYERVWSDEELLQGYLNN